jgi:cysteine desulfurase / selenocysteine lyase
MLDQRSDFKIFKSKPTLNYLDSAASSLTPEVVSDVMSQYYGEYRSNVHRGLYPLAVKATEQYEGARAMIAKHINATPEETIFTSGTTHGLNLLASGLGQNLRKGDNAVLTRLEHHANLIPWQQAATRHGFKLRFIDLSTDGMIDLNSARKLIDRKTKAVSFAWISNALGTVAPVKNLVNLARDVGAISIIDAAQVAGHQPIDVKKIDCDFLAFSGHKMYGPTGIGVLYGKIDRLNDLPPYMFGGEMIDQVTYEDATWAEPPLKFEAGTQNIAGAIGIAAAFGYLSQLGWEKIVSHEEKLKRYLLAKLHKKVNIVGLTGSSHRAGVVSFDIPGVHAHDVAEILGTEGICIRAGHHCCAPLMKYLGVGSTARVSLGLYNTKDDIDQLIAGISKVKNTFKV